MSSITQEFQLPDVESTEALGRALAHSLRNGGLVTLTGDLGAGKTTLVRALLRELGHDGPVRSPTYAIVEPYRIGDRDVFHLDLYRIADPDELEYLGIRDLLSPGNLVLIEWPERAGILLPEADLQIYLRHENGGRSARIVTGVNIVR